MEIPCQRCEKPAACCYDTELLCRGCLAAEMRRDRVGLELVESIKVTQFTPLEGTAPSLVTAGYTTWSM